MSDRAALLTCSGYFPACPQLRLTGARGTKGAEGNSATGSIRDIAARDTRVWSVSVGAVSAAAVLA